jgi:hypothetical protein
VGREDGRPGGVEGFLQHGEDSAVRNLCQDFWEGRTEFMFGAVKQRSVFSAHRMQRCNPAPRRPERGKGALRSFLPPHYCHGVRW